MPGLERVKYRVVGCIPHEYLPYMEDGVKKEKILYLFQKSIQIFPLAYSTGKYCPSNSGIILVL
jgi:hypothetical protein